MLRVSLIAILVTLSAGNWVDECNRHCTHDKNHVKSDILYESCETYRYVLPRPKVYRKCKAAYDSALNQACEGLCKANSGYGAGHINDEAHHECKSQKDEVPKPISHEACVAGYLGGARAAQTFATEIQARHDAAMESSSVEADAAAEAARVAAAAEAEAEAAKAEAAAAVAKAKAAAEAAAAKKAADEAEKAAAEAEKARAEAAAEEARNAAEEKQQREIEAARDAARAAYSKAQEEEASKEEETETNSVEIDEETKNADEVNLRGGEDEVTAE